MEKVDYSDDIPYQTAYNAYRGTSFSPEVRAKNSRISYSEDMNSERERIYMLVGDPEAAEIAFQNYKRGYLSRYLAYLGSRSRTYSSMIAGPANFPVRRMEKLNRYADNAWRKVADYDEKFFNRLEKQYGPGSGIIQTGKEGSLEALEKKLASLEKLQATMKEANAIVRKKGLSTGEKVKMLDEIGIGEEEAKDFINPNVSYLKPGFQRYQLSNNNAEIRRLSKRIEIEKKLAVMAEAGNKKWLFNGGTVTENYEQNRLQIAHDKKPDRATIQALKKAGFRWAPSQGAWQRQLNTMYRRWETVEALVGPIKPAAKERLTRKNATAGKSRTLKRAKATRKETAARATTKARGKKIAKKATAMKRTATARKSTALKTASTARRKKTATKTKSTAARKSAAKPRKKKKVETKGELAKEFQRNIARATVVQNRRRKSSQKVDNKASHKITRIPTNKNTDVWIRKPGRSDLIGVDNAANNRPTLKRDIRRLNKIEKE